MLTNVDTLPSAVDFIELRVKAMATLRKVALKAFKVHDTVGTSEGEAGLSEDAGGAASKVPMPKVPPNDNTQIFLAMPYAMRFLALTLNFNLTPGGTHQVRPYPSPNQTLTKPYPSRRYPRWSSSSDTRKRRRRTHAGRVRTTTVYSVMRR